MSYLDPPPFPAPVIVTKDVGGLVTAYQARTDEYRSSNREVRLHECRSACTLALSLPNVCVYPDSILKFHLAYNERNHISDYGVSQQLFDSYPAAVRARLGTLTREYHVLSGAELIRLGVRDCNEPRVMVASVGRTVQRPVDQDSSLSGMMHGVMNTFSNVTASLTPNASAPSPQPNERVATRETPKPANPDVVFADFPLPPARPAKLESASAEPPQPIPPAAIPQETPPGPTRVPTPPATQGVDMPLPPPRPASIGIAYTKQLPIAVHLRMIGGAAPILSSNVFVAFNARQR